MEQATKRRFVLTTRSDESKALYEFYARRGEAENWIKDFNKVHLMADRLSCHRFISNQFRLLLHACAYWLMDMFRRKLIERGARRMQLDTLRLSLIKIGGRVRELLTKSVYIWPRGIRGEVYGTPSRELSRWPGTSRGGILHSFSGSPAPSTESIRMLRLSSWRTCRETRTISRSSLPLCQRCM
jgi:hypothetical protein